MADLGESWTTQQLVEFLSLVSSFPDEQSAICGAVERAAEALEAEVGAVVSDGRVRASTGFPADSSGMSAAEGGERGWSVMIAPLAIPVVPLGSEARRRSGKWPE